MWKCLFIFDSLFNFLFNDLSVMETLSQHCQKCPNTARKSNQISRWFDLFLITCANQVTNKACTESVELIITFLLLKLHKPVSLLHQRLLFHACILNTSTHSQTKPPIPIHNFRDCKLTSDSRPPHIFTPQVHRINAILSTILENQAEAKLGMRTVSH